MGCSELVEALELRLRGEATGSVQEELDAHLVSCADCRGYLEVAARVEQQLAERAQAPDPAALATARQLALTAVAGVETQNRRLKVLSASVLLVPAFDRVVGGPWVGHEGLRRALVALGAAVALLMAIGMAVVTLRRRIAPLTLSRGDGELLLVYRQHLDRQLRRARLRPWLLGLLLTGTTTFAIAASIANLALPVPVLGALAAGAFAGALSLLLLMPTLRHHREGLQRERQALS